MKWLCITALLIGTLLVTAAPVQAVVSVHASVSGAHPITWQRNGPVLRSMRRLLIASRALHDRKSKLTHKQYVKESTGLADSAQVMLQSLDTTIAIQRGERNEFDADPQLVKARDAMHRAWIELSLADVKEAVSLIGYALKTLGDPI